MEHAPKTITTPGNIGGDHSNEGSVTFSKTTKRKNPKRKKPYVNAGNISFDNFFKETQP